MHIPELDKPAGPWCAHVCPGRGCGVYETRPQSCRDFLCGWMTHPSLDERWRPDRAGFLLQAVSPEVMMVRVEPSKPDAWKRAPYYAQLKDWARIATAAGGMVLVQVRDKTTVLLPHADVPVGDVLPSDQVSVRFETRGVLRRAVVEVTHTDGSIHRHAA
jgi:hypothetical protein